MITMTDVICMQFQFHKKTLHYTKSKEIVCRARIARRSSEQLPAPCQSVERVDKLTVLGITINGV